MLYQLSYTRLGPAPPFELHRHSSNGGGRIRTYVEQSSADLQSAAISHSATPPRLTNRVTPNRNPPRRCPGWVGMMIVLRLGEADEGTRTLSLLITNQLLYQLSYASELAAEIDRPL